MMLSETNTDDFYMFIPLRPLERFVNKYSECLKSLSTDSIERLCNIIKIILNVNPIIKENTELKNKYENLLNLIQEGNDAKKSS